MLPGTSVGATEHEREPAAEEHIRGVGSTEQLIEDSLTSWMRGHREACLRDAATKQYDSAVESAKQFGCPEQKEVLTAQQKNRCRLDGGEDEDRQQRLPNVDVVPSAEPAHVMREKMQAADEGRAMKHSYRGMSLTGAPAA